MGFKVDPALRDLIPPLGTEELEALKADIKANGIISPVIVDENGTILDGHHRAKIDPSAPRKVIRGLSPAEKQAYVFRSNFARRNLSVTQKSEARRKMKAVAFALRAEDAKRWTQAAVAAVLGVARETVRDWFTTRETNGGSANAFSPPKPKPVPDARVKVDPRAKAVAVKKVQRGEAPQQVAADLGVTPQAVNSWRREEEKKAKEQRERKEASKDVDSGVILGDFRKVGQSVADNSCSLIFTDPPYDRKSLPLFEPLGEPASRVLIDGGSLVTFCGQYVMDEVMQSLGMHLRYFWVCCCMHTGDTASMREYGIKVKWKPMLWFVKGKFRYDREVWVEDLVVSKQEKDCHPWQQSVLEAKHFIKTLTRPGDLVCDPFCGGGTTALSAKELKRKFWTCDVDDRHVRAANGRLA